MFRRSLTRLVVRLNGLADAACAMPCTTKKAMDNAQAPAPTITLSLTFMGNNGTVTAGRFTDSAAEFMYLTSYIVRDRRCLGRHSHLV